MRSRIIRPMVFLSHSKADISFILRIQSDLHRCQIDTWLDEVDIRIGSSWLESIFEEGIPTCDSIFVYLTDTSVASQMVKKEIDVGIIQKLKNKHVALLPYVSYEELRDRLRADIQALHVPVLNDTNYCEVLPRLVAEVWRSFTDRIVHVAVQEEQNQRLRAELELERLSKSQHQSVFTPSEAADFKYIYDHFNTLCSAKIRTVRTGERTFTGEMIIQGERSGPTFTISFNIGSLVGNLPVINDYEFEKFYINNFIVSSAFNKYQEFKETRESNFRHYVDGEVRIQDDLLMFGLAQMTCDPPTETRSTSKQRVVFTDKMFRYRYWLAFNSLLSNELVFSDGVVKEDS